jgi:hypothetical protein
MLKAHSPFQAAKENQGLVQDSNFELDVKQGLGYPQHHSV